MQQWRTLFVVVFQSSSMSMRSISKEQFARIQSPLSSTWPVTHRGTLLDGLSLSLSPSKAAPNSYSSSSERASLSAPIDTVS